MEKNRKYAYIVLEIKDGEREYLSKSVVHTKQETNLDELAEQTARTFWEGTPSVKQEDSSWWEHWGSETLVRVLIVDEITKEEYDVLSKFL